MTRSRFPGPIVPLDKKVYSAADLDGFDAALDPRRRGG